ncbi:uncharacterized protein [Phyllobates terribilis]|uniref:uncharacterized protein n=1 Tax=Phyllobates terribilis TaxID=111132 RepID=UPI003CCB51C3
MVAINTVTVGIPTLECRSIIADDTDIIIVGAGAGVAGSGLSYMLSKDERCIHVIERDLKEPNRIVGELLQPGGYLKLIELGLEDYLEKIDAQKVFGYALFNDGKSTRLSYPLEIFHGDVSGRGFHNGRFIQRLREKVASLPMVQIEQGSVTSLLEENGIIKGLQYRKRKGEELRAYAPLNLLYLTNVYGFGHLLIPFPSPKRLWIVDILIYES